MSKPVPIIDRIRINKPCTADWDSMIGNDQVRFCEHCAKSVHDLSTMTRAEAERLVTKSNGNLCIRYRTLQDGSIATVVRPKPFVELTRKLSKIAAGAFAVALTVSNSAIAKPANARATVASVREKERGNLGDEIQETKTKMVAGTVKGSNNVPVSGAHISLRGKTTGHEYHATSGAFGVFMIDDLSIESYSAVVAAPGFKTFRIDNVDGADPIVKLELLMQEGDPSEVVTSSEVFSFRVLGMLLELPMGGVPGVNYSALQKFENGKFSAARLDGTTKMLALKTAVSKNRVDAVKALLAAGVLLGDYEYEGPLIRGGHQNIPAALFSVSYQTSVEIVDDLIRAGADINARDSNLNTPILHAAQNGSEAVVKELIKFGADINVTNRQRQTLLMLCAGRDSTELVKALIKSGADVNQEDRDGRTALIQVLSSPWLKSEQTREVIRLLKQHGATEFIEKP